MSSLEGSISSAASRRGSDVKREPLLLGRADRAILAQEVVEGPAVGGVRHRQDARVQLARLRRHVAFDQHLGQKVL